MLDPDVHRQEKETPSIGFVHFVWCLQLHGKDWKEAERCRREGSRGSLPGFPTNWQQHQIIANKTK